MRDVNIIFVHCTAGNQRQRITDLLAEFRRKGWKNPGYHYVVDADGVSHQLQSVEKIANGVSGYNAHSIHVAYLGGIDAKGRPVDNRTEAQKVELRELLTAIKRQFPEAKIMGHRDISPDVNHNGKVDPNERIKECPCFDAITEYADI